MPEANELFSLISLKTYGVATTYPLEAFAILAAARDQMERATRLFGAVESLYASIHFEMSAKERAEHDQAILNTRAALGDEAYTATYEAGKQMSLDEAVAYALKELGQ